MNEEMTLSEAMAERHSVRSFLDRPIPEEIREELERTRQEVCSGKKVRIRIVYDEPEGFDSRLAHYGRFRNVRNYMVLSAPHGQKADEEAGYVVVAHGVYPADSGEVKLLQDPGTGEVTLTATPNS
ncbi:MAG: hypothetical protein IJI38_06190, partial [Clostridia bacterium]|nr:hypothetical protein [Clostridia bacterium]